MSDKYEKIYVVPGSSSCLDFQNPATGRSCITGESLEQIRLRHPTAELVDFWPWQEAKEKSLCTEPQEITEERFIEMLEVLPPQRWHRGRSVDGTFCQSFELCEHLNGRVTSVYVQVGDKYFEFNAVAGQTLEAHFTHCGGLTKPVAA